MHAITIGATFPDSVRHSSGTTADRWNVEMDSSAYTAALNSSVLVLNRFYMAIHVVSVRRALVLLYRELAEVICVDDGQYNNYDFEAWLEISEFLAAEKNELDDWIRGVGIEIQVPRIVRLYRYDRLPKKTLRFNRRNLFARDDHQCQYCAMTFPQNQLSFDHIVPRSRGGTTNWENVVCCCLRCNTRKGNRTPKEAGMRLIRNPGPPKQSPLLSVKLDNPKYESWRTFCRDAVAGVDVAQAHQNRRGRNSTETKMKRLRPQ